jgi:hypothetical protein
MKNTIAPAAALLLTLHAGPTAAEPAKPGVSSSHPYFGSLIKRPHF